jgi:hypothetical protein
MRLLEDGLLPCESRAFPDPKGIRPPKIWGNGQQAALSAYELVKLYSSPDRHILCQVFGLGRVAALSKEIFDEGRPQRRDMSGAVLQFRDWGKAGDHCLYCSSVNPCCCFQAEKSR